jgi:hypothetical protein
MIRACTQGDVDWLVGLATEFNARLFDLPLDMDKTYGVVEYCIDRGVALRSDSGAILGLPTADIVRDHTIMTEVGWYATDGSGLDLLDAFIEDSKENWRVDEIRMTTLEANKRAAVLLKRRGFKPLETNHILRLT